MIGLGNGAEQVQEKGNRSRAGFYQKVMGKQINSGGGSVGAMDGVVDWINQE